MESTVTRVIEGTVLLVLAYLVLTNASGFSSSIGAVGGQYTNAVTVLQGRSLGTTAGR